MASCTSSDVSKMLISLIFTNFGNTVEQTLKSFLRCSGAAGPRLMFWPSYCSLVAEVFYPPNWHKVYKQILYVSHIAWVSQYQRITPESLNAGLTKVKPAHECDGFMHKDFHRNFVFSSISNCLEHTEHMWMFVNVDVLRLLSTVKGWNAINLTITQLFYNLVWL